MQVCSRIRLTCQAAVQGLQVQHVGRKALPAPLLEQRVDKDLGRDGRDGREGGATHGNLEPGDSGQLMGTWNLEPGGQCVNANQARGDSG